VPASGPASCTSSGFRFPKTARILRATEFRRVYQNGSRFTGPYFSAFCLQLDRASGDGPRLGFTVPRAFGKAVKRNRARRRIRELLRLQLPEIGCRWDIVINPRRSALNASQEELEREVSRLVRQCARS
jgi:ribonuclease P protein component